jgi:predicted metalloprotease with PDZ domain
MLPASERQSVKPLILEYNVIIREDKPDHIHLRATMRSLPVERLRLTLTQNYGQVKKLDELIKEILVFGSDLVPLNVKKIDEFLWEVDSRGQEAVVIDYAVNNRFPYTSLNSVRLPFRDADHVYFPAASVFVHPEEKYLAENNVKIQRIHINFDLPKGWLAATSWGTGRSSYDLSPPSLENLNFGLIGAGAYRVYSFKVRELPVEIALLNSGPIPDGEINRVVEEALLSGYNLFGFIPKPRLFALFQFIFDRPGQGSGNALGWSVNLNYGRKAESPDWLEGKSHIFHEIFHFWNGTEAEPISRAQSDHSLIWFTEGITRFYQYKNMLRSGVISEENYYHELSKEYGQVYRSSRREDGLDNISKDYYSDQKALRMTYAKGCCLAFALDSALQHASSGRIDFDEIMKKMLEKYDFRLKKHCYTHKELNSVFREVLGDHLYPGYERLYGKDFITEFESILTEAGFKLVKSQNRRLYFGIIDFGPPSGPLRAFELDRESPAYQAGLREEDILIEVNGRNVVEIPDILKALEGVKEGESVDLLIERQGRRIKLRVPWESFETSFDIRRKIGLEP